MRVWYVQSAGHCGAGCWFLQIDNKTSKLTKRSNRKIDESLLCCPTGRCGVVVDVRGPESGGPRLPTAQAEPLATPSAGMQAAPRDLPITLGKSG